MDDSAPDPIQHTKRRVYLVGLPLGALASLVLLWVEWQQGSLHIVDGVGLPLLALLNAVTSFFFWRRAGSFRVLELVFFVGFASMLVASLGYSLFQITDPETDLRNLIGLGYWSPVLYVLALLVFGVETGIRLSTGVFVGSLGVWIGQMLVSGSSFPFERSLVFQLYASDALLLLLLYGLGVILRLRAQQAARLEHDANTDPLTLLPNRRYLMTQLAQEAARSARSGRTFSIVLLDIDHFKRINDLHGHDVGDRTLRGVAVLLAAHARNADVIGRWGGEEFLLLLPDQPLAAAAEVAERLREMVALHPFDTVGDTTASFGVAEYQVDGVGAGETVHDLLRRADRALYEAKALGRNRVVPPLNPHLDSGRTEAHVA